MSAVTRVRQVADAVVPPSTRRIPTWAKVAAVPSAVLLVALLFWLGGGVLTNDATAAMVLTGVLVTVGGLVALWVGLKWRGFFPAFLTYAVVAGVVGGYLLVASTQDKVVDEDVVTAPPAVSQSAPAPAPSGSAPAPPPPAAPVQVAAGGFVSGEHETVGTATVIQQPDGSRVLTLTGFETDPGPDLRVYVTPSGDGSVGGAVDVGALKGNVGDQQYDLPVDAALGAVVIWCRAFSVDFGTAALA